MQDDLRVLVDSELETAFLNFKLRMCLVQEHLDKDDLKNAQECLVISCEHLNRITVVTNKQMTQFIQNAENRIGSA